MFVIIISSKLLHLHFMCLMFSVKYNQIPYKDKLRVTKNIQNLNFSFNCHNYFYIVPRYIIFAHIFTLTSSLFA